MNLLIKMISYPDLPDRVKQFQQMIMQKRDSLDNNDNGDDDKMKSQVDTILDEIINLTIKHFLLSNLELDSRANNRIKLAAVKEFNYVVNQLKQRLAKVDYTDFLTHKVVIELTKHFEAQSLDVKRSFLKHDKLFKNQLYWGAMTNL